MARNDLQINVTLDRRALNFFQNQAPQKLKEARRKAVEAAGVVWADEAKDITRQGNHIDTGLYVNSIGYSTGTPANPIHNLNEGSDKTTLQTGADVAYAEALEKRFAIFARAVDVSESRMLQVAATQVRNTLGL
ncbi:hypothetical protein [Lysinibacillus fusiformis]|uniref:hypothetical protein n=1 Tax=Lysinibacillus fusiformis TaxID=28031 RepID=UPI003D023D03